MLKDFLLVIVPVLYPLGAGGCGVEDAGAAEQNPPPCDYFSEDFSAGIGAGLQDPDGGYSVVDGTVRRNESVFRDNRHYVSTVVSDYLTRDWTYELTVDTELGPDIWFVGIGEAT